MNKKFEFTGETKVILGHTLHRIRALISFGEVEAGELGGWIEKEENLDASGNAWVSGNAQVYGNARVSGDARVCDDAQVSGDARVYGNARVSGNARVYKRGAIFWISNVGSRDDTATFFACRDKKIKVIVGCFFGDLDEFAAAVQKTHGDNTHAKVYRLAIEMAKERIKMDDMPEESNDG